MMTLSQTNKTKKRREEDIQIFEKGGVGGVG